MARKDGPTLESQLDDELHEAQLAVHMITARTIMALEFIDTIHQHATASFAEAVRVIHEFKDCPERPDQLRVYRMSSAIRCCE